MFIDLHILQTVPYGNLNRDDAGTPKTVVYGGTTRARVSSQSWKRATRRHLEALLESAGTYRTRNPHDRLAEVLAGAGRPADESGQLARAVFKALGTSTKDGSDNVILFVAEAEIAALAEVAAAHSAELAQLAADTKGKAKPSSALVEAIKGCLTVQRPTSVALFGRMLAASPDINVDAAMQVAHAFSVHSADIEVDYFTAAEDIPQPDDLTGGAHIGTAEFVAATFYRYATLDMSELLLNSGGDAEMSAELARVALKSFCLSLPTGKNNVTAPHTVPSLVHAVVRSSRPVSYAAAFEAPVRRSPAGGYESNAVSHLAEHARRVGAMLGDAPVLSLTVSAVDGSDGLGTTATDLGALVDEAVGAAAGAAR